MMKNKPGKDDDKKFRAIIFIRIKTRRLGQIAYHQTSIKEQ